MPIELERLRLKISRTSVGLKDMMCEWLTCLMRFLLLMWIGCLMCFVDSTSLSSHRRLNPIIVASHHMFTIVGWVLGYMCKKGVIEWYQSMVHPLDWMGNVCWSCIHVSCMCVSYTCIPCSCSILLMIGYG